VLIRLRAAALNRRDWWIQQGQYASLQYPAIVGSDGAGTIVVVGEGVSSSLLNQDIIINPGLNWGKRRAAPDKAFSILGMPSQGTLAEFVSVPVDHIHAKPTHLSWEEAAAIPLAGVTAHRALFYRAGLKAGEKLLVTGAGGGAAQLALLFGVATGAQVYVTSSSQEKLDACIKIGASGGVLYTTEGWEKALKEQAGLFDVILDSAGGQGFGKLFDVAEQGARITFFGGTAGAWPSIPPQKVFWKQISILGTTMGSKEDFSEMIAFVEKHKIRPTINHIFPLDQTQDAFDLMGQGDGIGKIVIRLA
jgi:NADPH:quinone reductase-like Zn-dependent oxidoreductase